MLIISSNRRENKLSLRKKTEMTARQYKKVLSDIGLNPYNGAPVLGIAVRQSQRYASEGDDHTPIPRPVSRLARMFKRFGIPKDITKD